MKILNHFHKNPKKKINKILFFDFLKKKKKKYFLA